MCPQVSKKFLTLVGYKGDKTEYLHGLAGFNRDVAGKFCEACPTCEAKRTTKPPKRPATTAIRVSGPFSLCQVGGQQRIP